MNVNSRVLAYQNEARACTRCHKDDLLFNGPGQRAYPVFQERPLCRKRVLFVLEAPNLTDSFDADKRRLTVDIDTDESGKFARTLLQSVDLRIDDVLFTNSVLCLPARRDGKHPVTARLRNMCLPWLARLIDVVDPVVVVTLGGRALDAVDRLERHGLSLSTGAGNLHPWRSRRLLPLYHPSRLGRVSRDATRQLEDIAALRDVV